MVKVFYGLKCQTVHAHLEQWGLHSSTKPKSIYL